LRPNEQTGVKVRVDIAISSISAAVIVEIELGLTSP
jgi:hypothetical protein